MKTKSYDIVPSLCAGLEQVTEKAVEMTLEGDKETAPLVSMETPLVGVVGDVRDSDSDGSELAVDIDEYPLEEDDPVSLLLMTEWVTW